MNDVFVAFISTFLLVQRNDWFREKKWIKIRHVKRIMHTNVKRAGREKGTISYRTPSLLSHRDRFGQISRTVDIVATENSDVKG